jgi:RimJ/RimL family protein N-acetyltransferase
VAGYVLVHSWFGKPEVSYWIGREFWGRGIATQALAVFLAEAKARPLYARAAKDNIASICVLEKNGFKVFGEDKGFSNARRQDVEEFIFILCEGEN